MLCRVPRGVAAPAVGRSSIMLQVRRQTGWLLRENTDCLEWRTSSFASPGELSQVTLSGTLHLMITLTSPDMAASAIAAFLANQGARASTIRPPCARRPERVLPLTSAKPSWKYPDWHYARHFRASSTEVSAFSVNRRRSKGPSSHRSRPESPDRLACRHDCSVADCVSMHNDGKANRSSLATPPRLAE